MFAKSSSLTRIVLSHLIRTKSSSLISSSISNTGSLRRLLPKLTTTEPVRCNSYYSRRIGLDSASPAEDRFIDGSPVLEEDDHSDRFRLNIEQEQLYEDHIRLSCVQRATLSIGSALMALYDPYRDDMVATFGETTGQLALEKMYQKMANHPNGIQILQDRPRINSETIDIEALGKLPQNTFGYAYYRFLTDNGVSPDTRKVVRFVDDAELAYVMQRYREVHDLVHTLLGMPTNMLGEVLVKWVEAIQTDLPMCWLGGLFGPIRLKTRRAREFYVRQGLQWALKCGHKADDLLCVYYERRFEQDLDQLRAELKIPTPPKMV